MTSPLTPEQERTLALERAVAGSRLLLDRLAAMEASGVLSPVAKDAVADWAARAVQLIQAVPPPVTPPEN
jgi:hypothetical protein